ncbi:YgeY family selenium metabolism-linked hydrolase [Clostridium sp. DJ247]|uniref:YgeY family selenium metabolism-linked hydrolase n=1 Tax=Clostridium sp. DJ247 TaxID=2726188 RepID=UPI0016261D56|nr:YgeY family selenium metabolism-linked hydrolase [Clostridium sp. DJ247]MBC2582804.1 YgeY family selenium metabolism-linked hydrolase [Clostridium sp. DJ247]
MLSKERENEIIKLCQELLAIKSYSGEEQNVVQRAKKAFEEMGYDDFYIDEYGNIIGHIKGKREGKSILFDAHIDTVTVPDETKWSHNPFASEIENNKIYGRGASDMKGAFSAMICAASYFAKDTNKDFPGDIYIAGVVHEECFEGVAARSISKKVKPDYVVIGEASQCNLKRGQRGRAEIVVETYGKPAHSANPEKGVNAVYKMNKLVEKIRDIKNEHDDFLGDGILELTDIKSSPYPGASVVPDYCKVTYDRRLLVGETKESVLKPILDIIAEMEKQDENFEAKAYYAEGTEKCYTGNSIQGERFFPAWVRDENDEYVQKCYKSLVEAGLNPEITHYSFCTNGSHYAGEAGIKTIGFGPSKENLAHTIDEYIEIDELLKAVKGYYAIAKGVLCS